MRILKRFLKKNLGIWSVMVIALVCGDLSIYTKEKTLECIRYNSALVSSWMQG